MSIFLLAVGLVLSRPALAEGIPGEIASGTVQLGSRDAVPIHFGVLPGLQAPRDPGLSINGFSLNLVGGHVHQTRGVEASLGFNWDEVRVQGAQLSLAANVVGGDLNGLQGTWGVNWAGRDVQGVQISHLGNLAGGHVQGAQLTHFYNRAQSVQGVQVALVNDAAEQVEGAQLGALNRAGDVYGAQVGLVNTARSVDGISLGLLNFVRYGRNTVEVWSSDLNTATLGTRFGSERFYTLAAIGMVRPGTPWWTAGLGWGGHIPMERLWLDLDGSVWTSMYGRALYPDTILRARATLGRPVSDHVSIVAGATASTALNRGHATLTVEELESQSRYEDGAQVVSWPGFLVGLQYRI